MIRFGLLVVKISDSAVSQREPSAELRATLIARTMVQILLWEEVCSAHMRKPSQTSFARANQWLETLCGRRWILPKPHRGPLGKPSPSARANHTAVRSTTDDRTAKSTDIKSVLFAGGRRWIRTTEVVDGRFTVCSLWPLGNPPKYLQKKWSW